MFGKFWLFFVFFITQWILISLWKLENTPFKIFISYVRKKNDILLHYLTSVPMVASLHLKPYLMTFYSIKIKYNWRPNFSQNQIKIMKTQNNYNNYNFQISNRKAYYNDKKTKIFKNKRNSVKSTSPKHECF